MIADPFSEPPLESHWLGCRFIIQSWRSHFLDSSCFFGCLKNRRTSTQEMSLGRKQFEKEEINWWWRASWDRRVADVESPQVSSVCLSIWKMKINASRIVDDRDNTKSDTQTPLKCFRMSSALKQNLDNLSCYFAFSLKTWAARLEVTSEEKNLRSMFFLATTTNLKNEDLTPEHPRLHSCFCTTVSKDDSSSQVVL